MSENMGNIITILICLVGSIILIKILINTILGLFSYMKINLKATKTSFVYSCADEAERILRRGAVNGVVSERAFMEAVELMARNGVPENEILNYLFSCNMMIDFDAVKTRRYIRKCQNRIADLDYADVMMGAKMSAADSAGLHLCIENEKEYLRAEIEDAYAQLK